MFKLNPILSLLFEGATFLAFVTLCLFFWIALQDGDIIHLIQSIKEYLP